ncbi:MAG TPA: protein-L-isoaspartate(D-aspartate) O-methyltransferase [Anaerolineales bacterium]
MDEDAYTIPRQRMVKEQLRERDIDDPRVLEAMSLVPRHVFVPPEHRELAYADGPLPIGANQTISQPYMVALMTQLLELSGDEIVLEVGTGSGYQAAVLAHLARRVHTIERHANLARLAARLLADLGLDNVTVHVGDGSRGLPEFSPYQAILVTAAAPQVPPALLEQLAEAGRLVIPVGGQNGQTLERWVRQGPGFKREDHGMVAFVPLLGEFGWQNHD